MPQVDPPTTRDEILAALRKLHDESTWFWKGFSTDAFFRPLGEAWSPADNVRHLTKSIGAVGRGLRFPRLALRLRFGAAKRPSRTYEQVREAYHGVLAAGGKAGRFTPEARELPSDLEGRRREIMEARESAADEFLRAAERWSEDALDRLQMPHPLLGKLTVREMLYFTLYHNLHHLHNVERRMAAS